MPADLHVHTVHSDSTLAAGAVIAECVAAGITTVAITDHDAVDGVAPTAEAGRAAGVRVVPGVEMTAYDDQVEVHIVGLFVDPEDEAFNAVIRNTREARRRRIHEIVARLEQLDIHLSAADVFAIAGGGAPGRPHVARALVRGGHVASVADAFKDYLANGGPACVPKHNLTPAEAARSIRDAGGVSVLAHPGVGLSDELVRRITEDGVQGVEVYHPFHSARDTQHYLQMAQELGLLISGGSDSHGGVRPETQIGAILLPDERVDELEAHARR